MLPREQSDLVGVHAPRQGLWTASGGAQGGSQDADSHSAVQQPGCECDGAYWQPRAALRLELLQEHGGGEALAPCLCNCPACMHGVLRCRPCALHRRIRWSVCTAERTAQATPPGVKIPPGILPRGACLMRPWTVRAVRADWAVADAEPQAALHHPQGRQRRHQAGALPSHAP